MRVARIAVPAALITALGAGVAGAVIPGDGAQVAYPAPVSTASVDSTLSTTRAREAQVSRHIARAPIRSEAAPKPKTSASETITPVLRLKITNSKYATTELNVRKEPAEDSAVVGVVRAGTKLCHLDRHRRVPVCVLPPQGSLGERPVPLGQEAGLRIVGQRRHLERPLSVRIFDGIGLTPDAIRVHRALCHRYPQITSFLGRRTSSGYHGEGRAVDNMISDSTVGWEIAKWVRAHAKELGAMEVIYRQHIWTVQRSSEGWRSMSDRGSPTANHMDHVHVSVYGNRGTV